MFSFFRKKPPVPPVAPVDGLPVAIAPPAPAAAPGPAATRSFPAASGSLIGTALVTPMEIPVPAPVAPERQGWMDKLSSGLHKTSGNIAQVFTGAQIDEHLYEELESALLLADTGVKATGFLLADVKRRVAASGARSKSNV